MGFITFSDHILNTENPETRKVVETQLLKLLKGHRTMPLSIQIYTLYKIFKEYRYLKSLFTGRPYVR